MTAPTILSIDPLSLNSEPLSLKTEPLSLKDPPPDFAPIRNNAWYDKVIKKFEVIDVNRFSWSQFQLYSKVLRYIKLLNEEDVSVLKQCDVKLDYLLKNLDFIEKEYIEKNLEQKFINVVKEIIDDELKAELQRE